MRLIRNLRQWRGSCWRLRSPMMPADAWLDLLHAPRARGEPCWIGFGGDVRATSRAAYRLPQVSLKRSLPLSRDHGVGALTRRLHEAHRLRSLATHAQAQRQPLLEVQEPRAAPCYE